MTNSPTGNGDDADGDAGQDSGSQRDGSGSSGAEESHQREIESPQRGKGSPQRERTSTERGDTHPPRSDQVLRRKDKSPRRGDRITQRKRGGARPERAASDRRDRPDRGPTNRGSREDPGRRGWGGIPVAGSPVAGTPVAGTPVTHAPPTLSLVPREARSAAAWAVARVLAGASLDAVLRAPEWQALQVSERPLARELATSTIRFYFALSEDVGRFLQEPLAEKAPDVWALLLVGACQLRHTRIPAYAALDASVAQAKRLRQSWAPSLINAVLRQLTRNPAPAQHLNHPEWLLQRLRNDHPTDWRALLAANDSRAPLTLRVNQRRSSRKSLSESLSERSHTSRPGRLTGSALVLDEAVAAARLPHLDCAVATIQDEGAQLAAPLLLAGLAGGASTGQQRAPRILDACAAPGGKASHLLELSPRAHLTLLDIDAARMAATRERLAGRPGHCRYVCADATEPSAWWDGVPFDAILVDAPCSGTGSIRRNPDVRLLRRATDITPLAARQSALLAALWPLLAPAGCLLYCTCSLLSEENESVIDGFLESHANARADVLADAWGTPRGAGRLLLPATGGNDGFFFARLRHTP